MSRLREGRANTARGAAHFLRETVGRVRYGGASGQLTVRADSGFYTHSVVSVCRQLDVRFSITVRQHKSLRNLIEAIPETDWTPIPYWMDGAADVAESSYTPFQSEPDAAPVRLIVRRVQPTPGSQLALFVTYSYHGFITDREGETLELEADHRRHAEIENAIRDLKYGVGLNHLPSGRFAANAAWLAVQVMAHNLARWTVRIGLGEQVVTTKTLRRRFFSLAGRLTRSARRLTLHLPQRWPWETQFSRALARLRALPFPAWPNRQTTQPPRRLARSVPERLLLYAALIILPRTRNCGPSTSPWRGYRTLHPAISIGIKPSRIFPLPLIPCLPDMATSLRWIRAKAQPRSTCRSTSWGSPRCRATVAGGGSPALLTSGGRRRQFGCGQGAGMVASVECPCSGVGFVFQNPLSQKYRSTFLPIHPAAIHPLSVDSERPNV